MLTINLMLKSVQMLWFVQIFSNLLPNCKKSDVIRHKIQETEKNEKFK